ncbi:hypothetical protein B0T26DRAFT_711345 [Lasiosphaeria miniovina]|uniref:Transcription factor tau subunit sfc6 n=1 Tax=Lasiosphaeria miniovina TaxID=1954250 RepID=A0AA40AL99_9PEZI|nr:uncharacterized protein B0T26DRAFT_711345 [Lasiosphaeria miniovina]KAK0717917.1 hypothetical protein B0T26DRAFT_711345 [Lasiosphaeria miniovina]
MRLRQTRSVRKRYVEDPILLDDQDEHFAIPDDRDEDDDFDAQGAGPLADKGEDEDADGQDHDNDDAASSEPDEPDDEDADNRAPRSARKLRNAGAGMIQSRKSFHDIPHYPLETRIVTRVYAGPLRRYARYGALRDSMYGPEYRRIKIIWDLEIRWAEFPALPPALPPVDPEGITPSPWLTASFELDQERSAFLCYDNYQVGSPELQRSHAVAAHVARRLIPRAEGDLVTLIGPWDSQKEFRLGHWDSMSLTPSGLPVDDPNAEDNTPSGWMLNVGGIPLAVAWAPSSNKDTQLLAVAIIPFSDQTLATPRDRGTADQQDRSGSIQFWEFAADMQNTGLAAPSKHKPRLITAKISDWGRPKRLQWCPVPLDSVGIYGLLAVLCGDGKARVIDIKNINDSNEPRYEWIETPVVALGISGEYSVEVTCLTWVNTNRIALGHLDGSITLWSVHPCAMLLRVGVHNTYVLDICSAYPSNPYLVASVPVGGCATLTDLSQPSSEFTYFPVPAISFQPNMLSWNEMMQGFMTLYPSSTPNTTIAFLHHRFFCQARSICTGTNTVTCVSSGTSHPFILTGCADGSVSSCNALQKLFKQKGEPQRKIKIFEHEYRTLDPATEIEGARSGSPAPRGAVRILQGFLPEENDDPRTEKRKEIDRRKKLERKKTNAGKRGRSKKGSGAQEEVDNREAEMNERLASRVVAHEPLTRVTTAAWNPNLRFSCWAAISMASGLIKVMDLGVQ